MTIADTHVLSQVVDMVNYPLDDPTDARWDQVVSTARADLETFGCSVLEDFVRPEARHRLRRESERLVPLAHHTVETVNAYNIALDADLPADHPGRLTMERGNAFVARDLIPPSCVVQQLYSAPAFHHLIASCFGVQRLHPLADPLAGVCVNVVVPGREHPWHFDTNELTVSLLTVEPDAGGVFEFCPGIRTPTDERLDDVRAVLEGRGRARPRRLRLRPGDLQLFKGRYALHRVSRVGGRTARQSAIFAYARREGVVGSAERSRQLFGRVLPVHRVGPAGPGGDGLLD